LRGYATAETDNIVSGNVTCQDENQPIILLKHGLTYLVNPTTDFAIGGNSTASADFLWSRHKRGGAMPLFQVL